MKTSKIISLIFFLSMIMFAISVSKTAVKHTSVYGIDTYGWPNVFFAIEYDEGRMLKQEFNVENFLIDFSIWASLNVSIFLVMRILRVKRRPQQGNSKEGLERIRLKYEQSKIHSV